MTYLYYNTLIRFASTFHNFCFVLIFPPDVAQLNSVSFFFGPDMSRD